MVKSLIELKQCYNKKNINIKLNVNYSASCGRVVLLGRVIVSVIFP